MSAVLKPRKTRVTEALAEIIHCANNLDLTRESLMVILPELEPDEIKEIREKAREVGTWAWVVECACDSEMLQRIKAKAGDDEQSIVKAVDKEAYMKGQNRSTVYRNAQIFDTFKDFLNVQKFQDLKEKGYYDAALRAPDPEEALEAFAEKKSSNPFFGVRDALKEVEEIKEKRNAARQEFVNAIGGEQRKALAAWLHFDAIPTLDKLKSRCPDPRVSQEIEGMMTELNEGHDVLFIEAAEEAILYAWDQGYYTEQQMADYTFLPVSEVRRVMLNLHTDGYFIEQPQQWKPTQARGSRCKEWKRTNKPMPKITITPPAENFRAQPAAGT